MGNYYIKNIYGPRGDYPCKENNSDSCLIDFSSERGQKRFRECKGFLIRETGHKEKGKTGSKIIYAYGIIAPNQSNLVEKEYEKDYNGKKFPFAVRVHLQKRINYGSNHGIPLDTIRAILKSPKENMRWQSGLRKIDKDQFDKLCLELKKCSKKDQK
ncbi:MAG: hypothetical protein KAS87_00690 [Candidatus Omnitrophica bacterium]|nr:hypothetical protein [Candidatus Omnitrophota bacterium]